MPEQAPINKALSSSDVTADTSHTGDEDTSSEFGDFTTPKSAAAEEAAAEKEKVSKPPQRPRVIFHTIEIRGESMSGWLIGVLSCAVRCCVLAWLMTFFFFFFVVVVRIPSLSWRQSFGNGGPTFVAGLEVQSTLLAGF